MWTWMDIGSNAIVFFRFLQSCSQSGWVVVRSGLEGLWIFRVSEDLYCMRCFF
ncbi:hypothetical protein M758_UG037800 [Ceratodon purpureus]|nr:hypothetical protein M758_UG037800 [Ceratodon purpureus]